MMYVRNRWLLRAFWGKRSVYPERVGGTPGIFWAWLREDPLKFFRRVHVTSGARYHGSRARRLGKTKRDGGLQRGFPLTAKEKAALSPDELKRFML